jgi:hypothetical protein
MKDNKKKNILLGTVLNTSKDNIHVERSFQRRSTFMPIKNHKNLLEGPSMRILTSDKKNETFAETSHQSEDRKFNVLNHTHNDAFPQDGVKTSQIKVVARFRPINFVEDVSIILKRLSPRNLKGNYALSLPAKRLSILSQQLIK